ncbi:MAG TPA: Ppx/GppA phosphatase family protein [Verrucomicrobiae bacterium]|nr:Ppx/GppA phosphatase family protein [Verrucomicrobiae bacterium]
MNRVAIIDIGSNSARLVIYEREPTGQFRIVWSHRAPLRLVRDVDKSRRLSEGSISSTLTMLADFKSLIVASGARRILAVGTSALRDAENGPQVVARARKELGLRIQLIDAKKEGLLGVLGGIRALPVTRGGLFDLGGGSAQIVHFRNRRPGAARSLPLGSLRLSEAYLRHDPPSKKEIRSLRKYVQRTLDEVSLPRLDTGDHLVGVGGTIRNLAKIDARHREYPIARIHGYVLTRARLAEIVELLSHKRLRNQKAVAGLSRERGDSILGGALAIEILADTLGADEILVSGEGVREGLVYSWTSPKLPSVEAVRRAAVISLAERFSTWDAKAAARRSQIALDLLDGLEKHARPIVRNGLEEAATLLDIGGSVDFFDRYEHAATIVMDTELGGFHHKEIAMISAIIANADDEDLLASRYRPLLNESEDDVVEQAAVVLRLADEIQQRLPRNAPVRVSCRVDRKQVRIDGYGLAGWSLPGVESRFERVFDRRLFVRSKSSKS